MQPGTPSSPDPVKLAAAIADLERDFDKIDNSFALEAATVDRREQFAEAVGGHKKAPTLDALLRSGSTSRVLELAGEILAEIQPAVQTPTPNPAP